MKTKRGAAMRMLQSKVGIILTSLGQRRFVMAKVKGGGRKGHKPNVAAQKNRARYKTEMRREKNKARKARKEAKKAEKLARKRAQGCTQPFTGLPSCSE